jgi:hypothetical protein
MVHPSAVFCREMCIWGLRGGSVSTHWRASKRVRLNLSKLETQSWYTDR